MSAAIAGSEVAITVESMFSMNRATATMSGTRRSRVMKAKDPVRGGRAGVLPKLSGCLHFWHNAVQGAPPMIYILAALFPPLGLLLNGQPFSAMLNAAMIPPCFLLGFV